MRHIWPKIFLIGEPKIDATNYRAYLEHIGAPGWSSAGSDAELLCEVMGRGCYKSFGTDLNPNITKTREGNVEHLQNIIRVGHGSVLEHASVSFMICDVSRVFTHELVRHRVGVGISQESLRFVRLTDLGMWLPSCITENEKAMTIFVDTFKHLEQLQGQLANILELDSPNSKISFKVKKTLTSAMRRIAPIGLATNIGWTANFRTLRHVIEQRTHPSAEEEIRIVFGLIGQLMMDRYPAVFGDYEVEIADKLPHFTTENEKV